MTPPEQRHIVGGFAFELGKCKSVAVRRRMLGRLVNVDTDLADQVAAALGMTGQAEEISPAIPAKTNVKPSPASLVNSPRHLHPLPEKRLAYW